MLIIDKKKVSYKHNEITQLSQEEEAHFWARVRKLPEDDGCWEWQAALSTKGYGRTRLYRGDRRMFATHRVSWFLHFGEIPEGLLILHKCNNKICCNPGHLYVGDTRDNTLDMIAVGADNNPFHDEVYHAVMVEAARSSESISKRKESFSRIQHQQGTANSQFGTCWIRNAVEGVTRKIKLSQLADFTSIGWVRGR